MVKILTISNGKQYENEIIEVLKNEGFELEIFEFPERINMKFFVELSEVNRMAIAKTLQKKNFDFVFGIGYIHEISLFCEMVNVIYVSWVLEFPNPDLYRKGVFSTNTCLFLCDQEWVTYFKKKQVPNIHYLAPAIKEGSQEVKENKYDISFIDATRNLSKDNIFVPDENTISMGTKGYLDGLIHSQRVIYGLDILFDALPYRCLQEMIEKRSIDYPKDTYIEEKQIYVDYHLKPQLILQERLLMTKRCDKFLYLFSKNNILTDVTNRQEKYPETKKERIEIEKTSRVNLCINNRYMKSAMYWRVLECLGNNSFVVCNFQHDYDDYFCNEDNIVYFKDAEDMVDLIIRYENDEEARRKIAQKGYETVMELHLYKHRIREMKGILGL